MHIEILTVSFADVPLLLMGKHGWVHMWVDAIEQRQRAGKMSRTYASLDNGGGGVVRAERMCILVCKM